jgi:hypothetical protein
MGSKPKPRFRVVCSGCEWERVTTRHCWDDMMQACGWCGTQPYSAEKVPDGCLIVFEDGEEVIWKR